MDDKKLKEKMENMEKEGRVDTGWWVKK